VQIAQLDPTSDTVVPAHGLSLSKTANGMQDNSTFLLTRKPARSIAQALMQFVRMITEIENDRATIRADDHGRGRLQPFARDPCGSAILPATSDQDHRRPTRRHGARYA